MILRGITIKGTPYIFDVRECPILLNKSTIALVNKNFSPLLVANSIVIGNEENGIFEGDYVVRSSDHKYIGNIIYKEGFRVLLNETKEIVDIEDVGAFYTMVNAKFSKQEIYEYHSNIRFKCNGLVFDLNTMVCVDGDILVVYNKYLESLYVRDVKYCTGIEVDGTPIAYGDVYGGGIVVCQDNKPMIKVGEEYRRFVCEVGCS